MGNISDNVIKRVFDIFIALSLLIVLSWLILSAIILMRINTNSSGIFTQIRVGINCKPFKLYKIRSMIVNKSIDSTITTANDLRITRLGKILRKYKIDELPQLWNILIGDMSFVGPRPDVQGYADELEGEDKIILSVRPGLTGPAQIYYRNEESLLASNPDPQYYNDNVIWPHKVSINKDYVITWNFRKDLVYIFKTIFY